MPTLRRLEARHERLDASVRGSAVFRGFG